MNPSPELAPQLKLLRLSGILDSLESRNKQAIDAKLAYTEFLAMLIGDELARREQKKFSLRLRIFDGIEMHIGNLRIVCRQTGQLEIVGGKQGKRAIVRGQPFGAGAGPLRGAPGRRCGVHHLRGPDAKPERGARHRRL